MVKVRTLAVIPARRSSKRIKRKNIRLLKGRPLIYYITKTAVESRYITDIVITTDDEDVIDYILSEKLPKVHIRKRPIELCKDDVTLDPVVYDAYKWYANEYKEADLIVTLQPTSPLLSSATLDSAIEHMLNNDIDTLISVRDSTHLMWKYENNKIIPMYEERVNTQWLPKMYKETGGFLITKKEFVSQTNRIGKKVEVYEVPFEEAIDINEPIEWYMAEAFLNRLKIVIVTSGNEKIGLGHIYRMLTLAENFLGHIVLFLIINTPNYIEEVIEEYGIKAVKIENLNEVVNYTRDVDIVINDLLDTKKDYISMLRKKTNSFIVNFEDLGSGAEEADLVINALYERFSPPSNHLYGYKYAVLRDEFLIYPPNEFRSKVNEVLITFGGVDQNNLTFKVINAIYEIAYKDNIKIKVIIGPSYRYKKELYSYIRNLKNVVLFEKVANMAKIMKNVDLAITSNGRTVYELAAMRIPIISIAQNDRESLHTFARYSKGIRYLGIACNVDTHRIKEAFVEVTKNNDLRKEMFDALPYKELRMGVYNVKHHIIDSFWRWKYENNDW